MVSLVLASSVAFAQGAAPAGSAPAPAPAGSGEAPAEEAPKKPTTPAAGYAFSDKPAPQRRARTLKKHKAGPIATFPGFEQLPDGGSRVFVTLSSQVPVEERKAQGSVTYVLKGAHVQLHNNTNALVTVHFNTPVSRAKLVPSGNDLLLVIDLRAAAQPTWKMNEAQDKTAMLQVDFPKGDYLTGVDPEQQQRENDEAKRPAKKPAKKGAPPPPPAGGQGPNP